MTTHDICKIIFDTGVCMCHSGWRHSGSVTPKRCCMQSYIRPTIETPSRSQSEEDHFLFKLIVINGITSSQVLNIQLCHGLEYVVCHDNPITTRRVASSDVTTMLSRASSVKSFDFNQRFKLWFKSLKIKNKYRFRHFMKQSRFMRI